MSDLGEKYCSCELPVVKSFVDPDDAVVVLGQGEIKVVKTKEINKSIYTVSYLKYSLPTILATPNPSYQVGETISFDWDVDFRGGGFPLASRELDPQTTPPVNLVSPFVISVIDLKGEGPGFYQLHEATIIDEEGVEVSHLIGVNFYNKVYLGFNYKDGESVGQLINATDVAGFTSTLNSDIKAVYGGDRLYSVPASGALQYIYWLYPVSTTPINVLLLNGFSFPFKILPGVINIVNEHDSDISQDYIIVRSSNKFGTGDLTIKML